MEVSTMKPGLLSRVVPGARARMQAMSMVARTRLSMRHVAGPRQVELADDEAFVVCLVKNGERHVEGFIEHHLDRGVRHIVFVDNGSTDETVAIARRHAEVTIIRSPLPVMPYENHLRRYAVERFCQDRWCIVLDIDERFDYPHSDEISLRHLLRYLNQHSFNAVAAQMLDMFPEHGLAEQPVPVPDSFELLHRFYDIAHVEKIDYHDDRTGLSYFLRPNRLSSSDVKYHFGGIRKAVFDANCCLTKHAMLRLNAGLRPITHPHCSSQASVADLTVLLKHYKFVGDFAFDVRRHVDERTWVHSEYDAYLEGIETNPTLRLMQPTSREFLDVDALLREGFLVTSRRYEEFVASVSGRKEGPGAVTHIGAEGMPAPAARKARTSVSRRRAAG